jgi:uncharacterized protein YjbJ (UPF0337 family)
MSRTKVTKDTKESGGGSSIVSMAVLVHMYSVRGHQGSIHLSVFDSADMKASTKDKIKGKIRETKGSVKEKAGRVTRDADLEDRGTLERASGRIQRKVGDIERVFGN